MNENSYTRIVIRHADGSTRPVDLAGMADPDIIGLLAHMMTVHVHGSPYPSDHRGSYDTLTMAVGPDRARDLWEAAAKLSRPEREAARATTTPTEPRSGPFVRWNGPGTWLVCASDDPDATPIGDVYRADSTDGTVLTTFCGYVRTPEGKQCVCDLASLPIAARAVYDNHAMTLD